MKMTPQEVRQAISNVRLLALDADGTSLTTDKRCTARTVRAVNRLIGQGCLVVPATGRAYYNLLEKTLPFLGVQYVISADGAFVTECATGKRIWEQMIPCQAAAALARETLVEGNCIYFHRDDAACSHVLGCTDLKTVERLLHRNVKSGFEKIVTTGLDQYILREGRDIPKMGLWFSRPDGFDYYEPLVKEKFPEISSFRSDWNELEFTGRHTSKAEALKALASYLGIDRTQICAIGDNGNDIAMLEFAGLGVAVENAIEGAKEKADFLIGQNDEEGVAEFLETYFINT